MKTRIRIAACMLLLASTALHADDPPRSFDGHWSFTIQPPDLAFPNTGEVTLDGTTGTWKIFARKTKQMLNVPCIGRPFALTVLHSEPGVALVFQVHESDVIVGCSNVKVTLHAVSANRLEGNTGNGSPITMERD
jgi:hypothetical protein